MSTSYNCQTPYIPTSRAVACGEPKTPHHTRTHIVTLSLRGVLLPSETPVSPFPRTFHYFFNTLTNPLTSSSWGVLPLPVMNSQTQELVSSKLTSPSTQPADPSPSHQPQNDTMLSSRGGNGDGQYRELEDDHAHERQTHELTDMSNSQHHHAAAGADSDNTTTAGSMTATTMQKEAPHPRKDLPNWKWQGTLAVCFLTSLVNGMFLCYSISVIPLLGSHLPGGLEALVVENARRAAGVACPALTAASSQPQPSPTAVTSHDQPRLRSSLFIFTSTVIHLNSTHH